jgi:hypothetical protein
MPWVGFEPTIPALERAKAVHALDRAATVMEPLSRISSSSGYGLDIGFIDHLYTYTHHPELQVIRALSIISTLYKLLGHA